MKFFSNACQPDISLSDEASLRSFVRTRTVQSHSGRHLFNDNGGPNLELGGRIHLRHRDQRQGAEAHSPLAPTETLAEDVAASI